MNGCGSFKATAQVISSNSHFLFHHEEAIVKPEFFDVSVIQDDGEIVVAGTYQADSPETAVLLAHCYEKSIFGDRVGDFLKANREKVQRGRWHVFFQNYSCRLEQPAGGGK